jgi:hypothetical protein
MKITERLILVILILIINSLLLQNKIKKLKEKYYSDKIFLDAEIESNKLEKNIINKKTKIDNDTNKSNSSFYDEKKKLKNKTNKLKNLNEIGTNISKISEKENILSDLTKKKKTLNKQISEQKNKINGKNYVINYLDNKIKDMFEPNIYELNHLTNKTKFHLMDASNNNYLILKNYQGMPVLSSINDIKKKSNKEKTIFQLFKDDTELNYMTDPNNIPISSYFYNDNYVLSNEKEGYLTLENNNTLFLLYEKGLILNLIPVDNLNDNLSIKNGDKFKISHIEKKNNKISKNFLTYNDNLNQYIFSDNNLTPSVFKFEFINN